MTALPDPRARAAFFAAVRRAPFPNSLTAAQVSGMEAILDACPPDLGTAELAYCLGTAFHETARTMLPIKEMGGDSYFRRMYDPLGGRPATAKVLGNTQPGDGAKFCGRGYVQLTGRVNYRRATGELQNAGYLDRSLDLTVTPDMAMTPDIAAPIMFLGMTEGWFTGRKLSHFFGPGVTPDPVNARRIINGTDKAATIAGYYTSFVAALTTAGHASGAIAGSVPTQPVETTTLSPPQVSAPPVAAPPPADPPPTVRTGSVGGWLATALSRIWNP